MDAKLINATESVERLKQTFECLAVLSDAVKAGYIDEQTIGERKAQLAELDAKIVDATATEASLVADIEQHRKDDAALTAEAEAKAKQLKADAEAQAASLLDAAQKGAEQLAADAAAERNQALEAHGAVMAEKQAALADLERQITMASEQLAEVEKQKAAAAAATDALKAAAAAVLQPTLMPST